MRKSILFFSISAILITISCNEDEMNGAPSASDQVFTVNEDHAPGTLIGTIQASDPDDDPLTFMITAGNADSIFDMEINTGNIFLANDRNLDFESSESYELAIDISDGKDMIGIKSLSTSMILLKTDHQT